MTKTFVLTADHITLLRAANVGWEDCEFGAPAIDCKRPYGNSYVEGDIAKLLGWSWVEEDGLTKQQERDAAKIHAETELALQIILTTGTMEPGSYYQSKEYDYRSWKRVP